MSKGYKEYFGTNCVNGLGYEVLVGRAVVTRFTLITTI